MTVRGGLTMTENGPRARAKPEAGEYFVGAGKAPPDWFPGPRMPRRHDTVVTIMPDGSVSWRRSFGAAEPQ
jgi:hypothetical protein